MEEFLLKNPTFSMAETGAVASCFLDEGGYLSVTPQASGFDGAFAARMVRGS